jgi:lipopolysaccharide export LptBFGC system permease protein LptF
VLVSALVLGGVSALNTEAVIPGLADVIRDSMRFEKKSEVSPGILRDEHGNTLYARGYDPATATLRWVSFREHDEAGRAVREFHAERARWLRDASAWWLEDGVVRDYSRPLEPDSRGEPRVAQELIGRDGGGRAIVTSIRPIDIESLGERVSLLSFRELADQYRRQRYLLRLHVQLLSRLAAPWMHVILCMIGIPLMLRASGQRSVFLGLLVLLVVCASYFVTTFIFQDLGSDGIIPPLAAAWAPTVAFAGLGILLLDRVRT